MADADQGRVETGLTIVLDHRERASGLTAALVARWPRTAEAQLLVGDVEIGPRVIVERKTLHDFVQSLRDGRLFRQAYALSRVATRPLLLLEGTDPVAILGLSEPRFQGALLTVMLSFRVPVLRTSSVDESAAVLITMAKHEARSLARRAGPAPVRRARRALDVLTSIPGIGDHRARLLLGTFGSVAGVASADPAALAGVPGVGPGTVRAVRSALGAPFSPARPSASPPSPQPTDGASASPPAPPSA
jgi:ERCC4-type nuclease